MVIIVGMGLGLGWRPHLSVFGFVELVALILLGLFAFTWLGVLLGMLVRSSDAMQGIGFAIVFPLSFLAGTFVPISGMKTIPRAIGEWDPLSALVAAVGRSPGNPRPGVLAARPPRRRDGRLVRARHRRLRPAGPPAIQDGPRSLTALPAGVPGRQFDDSITETA